MPLKNHFRVGWGTPWAWHNSATDWLKSRSTVFGWRLLGSKGGTVYKPDNLTITTHTNMYIYIMIIIKIQCFFKALSIPYRKFASPLLGCENVSKSFVEFIQVPHINCRSGGFIAANSGLFCVWQLLIFVRSTDRAQLIPIVQFTIPRSGYIICNVRTVRVLFHSLFTYLLSLHMHTNILFTSSAMTRDGVLRMQKLKPPTGGSPGLSKVLSF